MPLPALPVSGARTSGASADSSRGPGAYHRPGPRPAFQRQERTASTNAFARGSPATPLPIWFMT